jgi:hypothetical protein
VFKPVNMAEFQVVCGIKKLNNNNYNTWSTCMMSYLQGQDLWKIVNGSETHEPRIDTNGAIHKWRVKSDRAMLILKIIVEEEMLEYFREVETPKGVWDVLVNLSSKPSDMRLQLLEGELMTSQRDLSIPQYFQKIKTIFCEIGELDQESRIPEARMKRIIIHGLKTRV